jgi:uncharacterized protein (TIGR02246 family)
MLPLSFVFTKGAFPMSSSMHQQAVAVYRELLGAWNRQDAAAFAELFGPDSQVTGFDGSQMRGLAEIASELGAIFAHHPTAAYVAKVREVRSLAPTVILIRAIVGMIPPGASKLNSALNAIQSVVLVTDGVSSTPRIVHFQSTPAAFHGRPHLVEAMTEELSRVHEAGLVVAAG